ncbi:hypothetical protein MC885_005694 [Smutsia gigantea]|nr:hypothetical protein MC885_005694 [Smutsia gigantea]
MLLLAAEPSASQLPMDWLSSSVCLLLSSSSSLRCLFLAEAESSPLLSSTTSSLFPLPTFFWCLSFQAWAVSLSLFLLQKL